MNLGVCHSADEEEKNKKEAGNADEESADNENGQVKDSNKAMNERAHGYLPEPPMEVEGIEETSNERQIILLGKDIDREDKRQDEEAEASNDECECGKCCTCSIKFTRSTGENDACEYPEEENKINLAKNELQNIKNGGCLTSGNICKYFDCLEG